MQYTKKHRDAIKTAQPPEKRELHTHGEYKHPTQMRLNLQRTAEVYGDDFDFKTPGGETLT